MQVGCPGVTTNAAYHIGAANVGSISDVPSMLAALGNRDSTFLTESATAFADLSAGDALQTLALPVAGLFGSSGLFLESVWSQGQSESRRQKQSRFVSSTNLAITFVAVSETKFTVWITDMSSNLPGPDLQCTVYYVPYSYNPQPQPGDVQVVSTPVTTDAEGLATVELVVAAGSLRNGNLYGVVEDLSSGALAVVPDLVVPSPPSVPMTASLITDRGVYKGGDSVHLKLYVRAQQGTQLAIPTDAYELAVQWTRDTPAAPVLVQLDPTTGAFSVDLTVPDDALYGDHSITLREATMDGNQYHQWSPQLGSTSVTVADPRPPTVLMALQPASDELVMPKAGSVDIKVTCSTYAGTAVAGQEITVRWQHSGFTAHDGGEISGDFDVTTGIDGSGQSTFALPAEALQFVAAGDNVAFSATWVGPTREVITADAFIIISESPWSVSPSASPFNPLPGFEFGSTAAVQEIGTDAAQSGVDVVVSLYAEGTSQVITSANEDFSVGAQVGASCTMVAGGAVGCPRVLPLTGKYLLISCASDPSAQQVCAKLQLGKTSEEWAADPLTSLAEVSMVPDHQSYEVGDTATFNFYCPFTEARALVVWGNKLTQRRAVSMLAPGAQTIAVAIGDECIGGCVVSIIVASPVQVSQPTLPVDLAGEFASKPPLLAICGFVLTDCL